MRRCRAFSNVDMHAVVYTAKHVIQKERELNLDDTMFEQMSHIQACYRNIGELFLDYLSDQGFTDEDIERALKHGCDLVIRKDYGNTQ